MTEYDWRSVHGELGRLAGAIEAMQIQLTEGLSRIAGLDCGEHRARLDHLEKHMDSLPESRTRRRAREDSDENPVVRKSQLEDTERIVLERVDDALEDRVAAKVAEALRIERQAERDLADRALSRWKVFVAGAVSLITAIGGAGMCNLSSRIDERVAEPASTRSQPASSAHQASQQKR